MSQDRPNRSEHPREMISAYLDGQLDAADRVRVFEHLRDCDACRWLLSDYRALASAARREAAPPVPADLADRIGRRIGASAPARFGWRQPLLAGARLPLATAAAVLVLASLWIVWRGRIPGEATNAPSPVIVQTTESAAGAPAPAALTDAPADGAVTAPAVAPAPALEVSEAPVRGGERAPATKLSPIPGLAGAGARAAASPDAGPSGGPPAVGRDRIDMEQVTTRKTGVWREEPATVPQPAPPPAAALPGQAAPPSAPASAPINKDQRLDAARQRIAAKEKSIAAPAPATMAPPEENQEAAAFAGTAPAPGATIEGGLAGQGTGAGQGGAAPAAVPTDAVPSATADAGPPPSIPAQEPDHQAAVKGAAAEPTLVFVMAEGRVTILPDSRVVLASGGYVCSVPAGGPAETVAFAEMRRVAARGGAPSGSPAAAAGSPATPVGEIVIPAPPAVGSLPPDVAGQLHLHLRTLLRGGILPRAEAQCGALPPALQQYR